jgi:hypothetical protein
MHRYSVILFKDKVRRKIIKKFISIKKADEFFIKEKSKSDEVIFEVLYENGLECKYEIGLIDSEPNQFSPVYLTDDFGRSVRVKLEDTKSSILKISNYKKEELIFDLSKNKKINFNEFVKNYLSTQSLKMVSSLNNKVVVQNDEKTNLFSLKNESEANRFIDALSNYFFKNKRADCIFIKDNSSAQRKYMLKLLEEQGFDKKILYRKSTTHPRLK